MALADVLKTADLTGRTGPRCSVCLTLEGLDKTDRAALEGALAETKVQHKALSDVLRGEGINLAAQTLSRHRKGECRR